MSREITYVHIFHLEKDARIAMMQWVNCHKDEIIRVNKVQGFAVCKGGIRHYFMGEIMYKKWCLGRDYIIDGKHYHSGYEVKE